MNRETSSRVFLYILVCTLFFGIFTESVSAKSASICTFRINIDFKQSLWRSITTGLIFVHPTAKIYIDNRYVGTCEANDPWKICRYAAPLKSEAYTVMAYRWGFKKEYATVTCSHENEEVDVPTLTLEESPSNCFLTVRIYNGTKNRFTSAKFMRADVYIDGLYQGNFYRKTVRLEAGKWYEIEARREGYVQELQNLKVKCDKNGRPSINLEMRGII